MSKTLDDRIKKHSELLIQQKLKLEELQNAKGKKILQLFDKFIDIYSLDQIMLTGVAIKMSKIMEADKNEIKRLGSDFLVKKSKNKTS